MIYEYHENQNYFVNYDDDDEGKIDDDFVIKPKVDEIKENFVIKQEDDKIIGEGLIKFFDDFIQSEEYKNYLEEKRSIVKRDEGVQCCLDRKHFRKENVNKEKYPLTFYGRKVYAFAKHFEDYVENDRNSKLVKAQEETIKTIRDKIKRAKILFLEKLKSGKEKTVADLNLLDFCREYDIDVKNLNYENREKVSKKVLYYKKLLHSKRNARKGNLIEIYEKLLRERKRKKEIDECLHKSYDYKVEKKKVQEVVDVKVSIEEVDEYEDIEEEMSEIVNKSESVLIEPAVESPKIRKLSRKSKGKQKKRNNKGSKKSVSKKKSKKEKKKRKSMKKINKKSPSKQKRKSKKKSKEITDIVDTFEQMEETLENKSISIQSLIDNVYYPVDKYFLCQPNQISITNFAPSKIYQRKVKVLNISQTLRKFKFCKQVTSQENPNIFHVDTLTIQKLAPGCCVYLNITFKSSGIDLKPIQGKLVFLTYDVKTYLYHKFIIPIACLPLYSKIVIQPERVDFGKIPIWVANNQTKVLKVKNIGKKSCRIVIGSLRPETPLNLPEDAIKSTSESLIFIKNHIKSQSLMESYKFLLDKSVIDFNTLGEENIKICMQNVTQTGCCYETYLVEIQEFSPENQEYCCIGTQEFKVYAEIIGHFITLSPDSIFYGVCTYNSNYQLSVDVSNKSNNLQVVSIKYPPIMSNYAFTRTKTLFVPAGENRIVCLKFCPTEDILKNNFVYYNPFTFIMEFPVYFCIVTKTETKPPPIKLISYAILTNSNNFIYEGLSAGSDDDFVDFGECTIYECVWQKVVLHNRSFLPQIFTFTNIPMCLTIEPNYGCGEIEAEEKCDLTIYFQPDVSDFMASNGEFCVKLHFETLFGLISSKRQMEFNCNRNSIRTLFSELKRSHKCALEKDVLQSVALIREYFDVINVPIEQIDVESLSNSRNERRNDNIGSFRIKDLCIRAKIVCPLYEFSFQQVEFAATPCASYSFMEIYLQPTKVSKKVGKYSIGEGKFNILSNGNNDIKIQPTCGNFKLGQHIRLVLTVSPNVSAEKVYESAKNLKYLQVYQKKLDELKAKDSKPLKKKGKKKPAKPKKKKEKSKTSKKTKSKPSAEKPKPVIKILPKDIVVSYTDLLNAEMQYLKYFNPTKIEKQFRCKIEYKNMEEPRDTDTLYLNTICKVIKPSFIANLITQRLNFGSVSMGMETKKEINIENIKDDEIHLILDHINPTGPFKLPCLKKLSIPPHETLKIPVNFEPIKQGQVEEFFEIASKCGTKLPLILCGEGIETNVSISPNFLVLRIDGSEKNLTRCPLEFTNKSKCSALMSFVKVCEIEGTIPELIKGIEKPGKMDKKKKGKERKSDIKLKKSKTVKGKHSNELTSLEQNCIESNFVNVKTSHFDFIDPDEERIELSANSKKSVSIYFGKTELLEKNKARIKLEKEKAAKNKSKDKNKKKKGGSKKSSEKTVSSKTSKKKGNSSNTNYYFISKYNILLGKSFYKDIILVARFT